MSVKNLVKHLYQRQKNFYSHLNIEDIADADYTRPKRVCKYFEMKILSEYHDWHIQSDALMLAGA